ncbi:hypothetical protein G7051_10980 [Dysgonomonas sp. HDW5B]|uniref:hypothetical protein n=1 Tax=Dysgonomonas sp. HDW5B TaxID=2714927 RepID=UPI0014088614|nr:hypothetical protein [Dysgonomonas sp. HDW5B]QIK54838.1 hypothetical protein G7051_10980 [Dysgonomonas sp. HDW5B]
MSKTITLGIPTSGQSAEDIVINPAGSRLWVRSTIWLIKDSVLIDDIANYQDYSSVVLINVGTLTDNNSMIAFRVTYS